MDAIIESYAQLVFSGMKKIEDVPSGLQSFVEIRVEKLKDEIRPIVETEELPIL